MTQAPATPFAPDEQKLLDEFRQGKRRALARLITRIDNGEDPARWLAELEPVGVAAPPRIIGITGPPGAGKSSLIGALIPEIRRREQSVAILAVDPDSPFTGGAILGDRIRMGQHLLSDTSVYIRSISSRGSAGGLSRSTRSICRLLCAFGFDLVLLETVGAGQAELMVMDAADIVLLVLVPGTGDGIQWEKAGQVEIADVFALNKADLPGIDALESSLRSAIETGYFKACPSEAGHDAGAELIPLTAHQRHNLWGGPPPIIRTVANLGDGVATLYDSLMDGLHRLAARRDPERSPVLRRLRAGLEEEFSRRMRWLDQNPAILNELMEQVARGGESLETAIEQAWKRLIMNGKRS